MTKKSTTEVTISVKVKGKLSVTLTLEEAKELRDALDIALGVRRIAQLEERIEGILKQNRWAEPVGSYPIVFRERDTPIQPNTPWCGEDFPW